MPASRSSGSRPSAIAAGDLAARLAAVRAVAEAAAGGERRRRRRTRCAARRPAPTARGSRSPGVSMTSAPPASGTSSRWRGRVAAAVVALAHRQRRPRLAREAVEQRRLARRPRSRAGPRCGPGASQAPSASSPVPSTTLTGEHGHRAAERVADLERAQRRVRVEVGLGEDDDRLRLGVGGEREEALEPAQVEVAVERADDERDVDVRGEHLGLGAAVARRPGDAAAARQHRVDDAGRRVRRHPVADGGEVGRGGGGVAQPPGRRRRRARRPRVARSSRPRCTAATRAGIRSGRPSAAKAASRAGVQPRTARAPSG